MTVDEYIDQQQRIASDISEILSAAIEIRNSRSMNQQHVDGLVHAAFNLASRLSDDLDCVHRPTWGDK